jgi:hypothetical protein
MKSANKVGSIEFESLISGGFKILSSKQKQKNDKKNNEPRMNRQHRRFNFFKYF